MQRIRIFGDSIMRGITYDETKQNYLPIRNPLCGCDTLTSTYQIQNNSIFGYTSVRGLQLLQRAIQKGLCADYVLLEYGGNDCNIRWKDISRNPNTIQVPRTSLQQFDYTIRSMISLLHREAATPILMTLPPINPERYLQYLENTGIDSGALRQWKSRCSLIHQQHERYSKQIEIIAEEAWVPLLDIRQVFHDPDDFNALLGSDGIHPNAEGHALIWKTLEQFLLQRKYA